MFVVVSRVPSDPDALKRVAARTGLALADVRMKLSGLLPRVLLSSADAQQVETIVAALEAESFAVFTVDPLTVPDDTDRFLARTFGVQSGEIVVSDDTGQEVVCPFESIDLVQRAVRIELDVVTEKSVSKQFSPLRALASGGLMLSKKVETTSTRRNETREALILLHRNDGEPDIMLLERRLNYRFLGAQMQSSSFANLERTLGLLREAMPKLRVEDRVARPGFVSAMPRVRGDGVDLGLHLVRLAQLRGQLASG